MYFVWVPYGGSSPATYHDGPVVVHAADSDLELHGVLAGLSLGSLASAWLAAADELEKRGAGHRRLILVRLRGLILDEVERRSPRRYRRWLRQGGPQPRLGRCRVLIMD